MEFEHAKLIAGLVKDYEHLTNLLAEMQDGKDFSLTYINNQGSRVYKHLQNVEVNIFREMARDELYKAAHRISSFDEDKIPLVPPFYKD